MIVIVIAETISKQDIVYRFEIPVQELKLIIANHVLHTLNLRGIFQLQEIALQEVEYRRLPYLAQFLREQIQADMVYRLFCLVHRQPDTIGNRVAVPIRQHLDVECELRGQPLQFRSTECGSC